MQKVKCGLIPDLYYYLHFLITFTYQENKFDNKRTHFFVIMNYYVA